MKKIFVMTLVFLVLFVLCACGSDGKTVQPSFDSQAVVEVEISSLPENAYDTRHYTSQEAIDAVVSYLNGLHLQSRFAENPNEYSGMTWVVELKHADGERKTVYLFGNMFYREDGADWMRMDYEEAAVFEQLLSDHPSEQ